MWGDKVHKEAIGSKCFMYCAHHQVALKAQQSVLDVNLTDDLSSIMNNQSEYVNKFKILSMFTPNRS